MRRATFTLLSIFLIAIAELNAAAHGAAVIDSVSTTSSIVVTEARRWIGTNPTSLNRLWCARFMNFVLDRVGYRGTGSDLASSFASYGRRVGGPQVGAIAVMTRGSSGGHVGVVSGVDQNGNPVIISGNHNRRVGVGVYRRDRIYAYVVP